MGDYSNDCKTEHTYVKTHLPHISFGFIYFMAKLTFDLETSSEFFVGNLNKTKTRDEIFQDLTKIKIDCLGGENLYISKFNMPKFNARKDQDGNLLLNLGYAFVTTRKPEMAQELIQKRRMKLEDGSDIEFKPINRNKRLVANQNCKDKNYSKINDVNGINGTRKNSLGAIGDWRNKVQPIPETKRKNLFADFPSAPASIHKNDSFENFLWKPFQESLPENNSCSSQSIFEICSSERSQDRSFHRKPLYSTGSDSR